MILVQYQVPPEETLIKFLSKNLQLAGLEHRNINVPVIMGHALFAEGISEMGSERNFPKIGVEWTQDRHIDLTFSRNYSLVKMSDSLRDKIISYRTFLEESKRISSDEVLQTIIESDYVERWDYNVESEIIVSGYATGGAGRRAIRWIFEAVTGVLFPTLMDISVECKVSCKMPDAMDVNLMIESYGTTAWGFEFPVRISQIKSVFRKKIMFTDISEGDKNNSNGSDNGQGNGGGSGSGSGSGDGSGSDGNSTGGNQQNGDSPVVAPSNSKFKIKLGGLETYGVKGKDE